VVAAPVDRHCPADGNADGGFVRRISVIVEEADHGVGGCGGAVRV